MTCGVLADHGTLGTVPAGLPERSGPACREATDSCSWSFGSCISLFVLCLFLPCFFRMFRTVVLFSFCFFVLICTLWCWLLAFVLLLLCFCFAFAGLLLCFCFCSTHFCRGVGGARASGSKSMTCRWRVGGAVHPQTPKLPPPHPGLWLTSKCRASRRTWRLRTVRRNKRTS